MGLSRRVGVVHLYSEGHFASVEGESRIKNRLLELHCILSACKTAMIPLVISKMAHQGLHASFEF